MLGMLIGSVLSWPWFIWGILAIGGLLLAIRWEMMILMSLIALGAWWAPDTETDDQFSGEVLEIEHIIESVVRDTDYSEERTQLTLDFPRSLPGSFPESRGLWRIYDSSRLPASGDEMVLPGDTLVIRCKLELPAGQRNPNGFDYRRYLWTRDVQVLLDEPVTVLEIRPRRGFMLSRTLTVARQRIAAQIESWLGRPQSGLAMGLLLGKKQGIDDEMRSQITALGIGHILAVSGLHVGYVVLVLLFLARLIRIPLKCHVIVVGTGLLGYVMLTGAPASVVRASIMAVLFVWGQSLERQANGWNLLGAAAIISILIEPKGLYTASFQLSFSAVAGILYIFPQLRAALQTTSVGEWIYNRRFFRYVVDLFLVGLGAQLGVLPVILSVFHAVSMWVLVANLVVVPLAGLALICIIAALLIWGIWGTLASVVAQAAWLFITLIQVSVEGFSRLPWLQFVTGKPDALELVMIICFIIGLPFIIQSGFARFRFRFLIYALLALNVVIWKSALNRRELVITFLDVGQGDAIHIALPDGEHMLLDAGMWTPQFDYGERVVFPYLRSCGLRRLDAAIISHPQADHMGGFLYILDHIPIKELWDTPNNHRSVLYSRLRNRIKSRNVPVRSVMAGQTVEQGKLRLYILAPDSSQLVTGRANDGSLVFKLGYGATSVLFMGDAEVAVERRLASYGEFLRADWLKVAHHGSATSTTSTLLKLCQPWGALLSVGRNNIYRHPSDEVLDRLNETDAHIHRTDTEGALVITSDGETWQIRGWRRQEPARNFP